MKVEVILGPLAEEDAQVAHDYYESLSGGLGLRFLNEVERVLNLIAERPEMYQEVFPGLRRALTRVFPFLCTYFEQCACRRYRCRYARSCPVAE